MPSSPVRQDPGRKASQETDSIARLGLPHSAEVNPSETICLKRPGLWAKSGHLGKRGKKPGVANGNASRAGVCAVRGI